MMTRLEAAGVPCSLIFTVADAVEHDQVQARNMIVQAGDLRVAGKSHQAERLPRSRHAPRGARPRRDGKAHPPRTRLR